MIVENDEKTAFGGTVNLTFNLMGIISRKAVFVMSRTVWLSNPFLTLMSEQRESTISKVTNHLTVLMTRAEFTRVHKNHKIVITDRSMNMSSMRRALVPHRFGLL